MTDQEWFELVRDGADEGWKAVWERVVEPESRSGRSASLMKRYSLARGDLMGMLYEDMIGRRKIDLYRGEGSFEGEIPKVDFERVRKEAWRFTHMFFRQLWNQDPVRCYVHVLKTRFFLSSEEIRDFLDISSAANVDQIFSRSVKFMRDSMHKCM